jgi:hypothetical protein
MGEIEDQAMHVLNAYEDHYLDKAKISVFDAILNRSLMPVNAGVDDDIYETIAVLGRRYPDEFKRFIEELRSNGLLS